MKRQPEHDLESEPICKKKIESNHSLVNQSRGQLGKFIKSSKCIEILQKKGVKSLFPIQYETFNHISQGKDLIARDKTGSGKTLAFALPVILRMRERRQFEKNHLVKFLIVLPTRELTIQVKDEIQSLKFRDEPDFRAIAVYGKSDINSQIEHIKRGIDIIVATPGRLIDLLQRDVVKMNEMQVLCLDQADEMLKQGFKEEIEKIYKYIKDKAPKKTQNLLFSATIPPWLSEISETYLDQDRQYVNLIKQDGLTTPLTLKHYSMKLSDSDFRSSKTTIISNVINKFATNSGNVIIFCEKKIDAMDLSSQLSRQGKPNQALHGDVPQFKRENAYRKFKEGRLKILVATNVAARGLDFPDIDLVIQVQPPNNTEPYIHRSGRTARKGKQGSCVTLFTQKTERHIRSIQGQAKIQFKRLRVQQYLGSKPQPQRERNKEPRQVADEIQLYIKYIPRSLDQTEVKQLFRGRGIHFRSMKLLKDSQGCSKGCGFMKFASLQDRDDCLKLDGQPFDQNRLSITIPNQK